MPLSFTIARCVLLIAVTVACTRPDLTAEIDAAETLLAEIDMDLRPSLDVAAAQELATAETALMLANRQVLSLEGTCDLTALETAVAARLDCDLVTDAVVPETANATTTREAIVLMRDYAAALNALATSESAAAVQTNSAAIMAAISEDGTERIEAFRSLAAVFETRDQALAETLGFIARQRQAAGLRRAVRTAHPVVEDLVAGAVAYYRVQDVELAARYGDLLIAADRVDDEDVLANPVENRRATEALRAAYAVYRTAEAASPVSDLIAFRDLHGALRDRITGLATRDEVLALVSEMETVLEAIEGGAR